MEKEIRSFTVSNLQLRAKDEGDSSKGRVLEGYASVFDQEAVIGGWFAYREVIRKGAFARAISENQDVRALFNHDADYVLGRTKAGTLTLTEDNHGLKVKADLPDTSFARDLVISMERGDINQMSFGFVVKKETISERDKDMVLREILDVDLFDISVVTFPAYEGTQVDVRSLNGLIAEVAKERDAEKRKNLESQITSKILDISVARKKLELLKLS